LRARQAELLRLLANLARAATAGGTPAVPAANVDGWRRRISQKVEDVLGLTESSKFERGDLDLDAFQRRTGDAQIVFILLLALARDRRPPGLPESIKAQALEVDTAIATTLEALATRVASGVEPRWPISKGSSMRSSAPWPTGRMSQPPGRSPSTAPWWTPSCGCPRPPSRQGT